MHFFQNWLIMDLKDCATDIWFPASISSPGLGISDSFLISVPTPGGGRTTLDCTMFKARSACQPAALLAALSLHAIWLVRTLLLCMRLLSAPHVQACQQITVPRCDP